MERALSIADRNIRTDTDRRYCLNDLHRASVSTKPRLWLRRVRS